MTIGATDNGNGEARPVCVSGSGNRHIVDHEMVVTNIADVQVNRFGQMLGAHDLVDAVGQPLVHVHRVVHQTGLGGGHWDNLSAKRWWDYQQ